MLKRDRERAFGFPNNGNARDRDVGQIGINLGLILVGDKWWAARCCADSRRSYSRSRKLYCCGAYSPPAPSRLERDIAHTEREIACYLDRLDVIDEQMAQGFDDPPAHRRADSLFTTMSSTTQTTATCFARNSDRR